jgi:hypothetical protein
MANYKRTNASSAMVKAPQPPAGNVKKPQAAKGGDLRARGSK